MNSPDSSRRVMGVQTPGPAEERQAYKGRRHVRTRLVDYVIAMLITLVAAWVAWTGAQLIRAEAHAMQARYRIDTWLSGKVEWTVAEWQKAEKDLQAAVAITPMNAALHDYLGLLYMLRGGQLWEDESQRQALYEQAIEHQVRFLQLRPSDGSGWASLAQTEYALDPCSSSQWEMWRKARYFSPYEPAVQLTLAELSLACTGQDPPDVQAWLLAYHASSRGEERKQLEEAAKLHGAEDRFNASLSAPAM